MMIYRRFGVTSKFFIIAIFTCVFTIAMHADDNSYKKVFEEYMEVSNSNAILNSFENGKTLEFIVNQTEQDLKKLDRTLTKEQKDNILKSVRELLASVADKISDQTFKIHKKYFTEQDLKDLIEFYKSPLGKKLAKNSVAIYEDSLFFTQNLMQQILPELQMQVMQILTKDSHK